MKKRVGSALLADMHMVIETIFRNFPWLYQGGINACVRARSGERFPQCVLTSRLTFVVPVLSDTLCLRLFFCGAHRTKSVCTVENM